MKYIKGAVLFTALLVGSWCGAQKKTKGSKISVEFPAGATPQEIGNKVAQRYLSLPFQNFNRPTPPKVMSYPEDCTWYGALNFAHLTHNQAMMQQLIDRFQPLLGSRDSLLP